MSGGFSYDKKKKKPVKCSSVDCDTMPEVTKYQFYFLTIIEGGAEYNQFRTHKIG